jgi:hypothetical protein
LFCLLPAQIRGARVQKRTMKGSVFRDAKIEALRKSEIHDEEGKVDIIMAQHIQPDIGEEIARYGIK